MFLALAKGFVISDLSWSRPARLSVSFTQHHPLPQPFPDLIVTSAPSTPLSPLGPSGDFDFARLWVTIDCFSLGSLL